MVEYATGFLLGLLAACAVDWWRRRRLRARVLDLQRDLLIQGHDVWKARKERDDAIDDRQIAWDLLANELRQEVP